jgi:lipopolysaccharide biosynthesis glycosyltransferase
MEIPGRGQFSYIGHTTLLKFQVMELQYEKVLYLDADTVVLGDISGLFRLPPGRVGAVRENTARRNIFRERDRSCVTENIDIDWDVKAFNAGVFVLRPSEWPDMKERAYELVSRFGRDVFSRSKDQQLLNIIFAGRIHELPGRYNFSPFYDDSGSEDPVIIHYLTGTKPWHRTYPRGHFYREFRRHIRFGEYPPLLLVDLMRILRHTPFSGIMKDNPGRTSA